MALALFRMNSRVPGIFKLIISLSGGLTEHTIVQGKAKTYCTSSPSPGKLSTTRAQGDRADFQAEGEQMVLEENVDSSSARSERVLKLPIVRASRHLCLSVPLMLLEIFLEIAFFDIRERPTLY